MTAPRRTGVYPGSFNPPTTAHLAIADAARRQCDLDIVVWAVSAVPLNKPPPAGPALELRMAVLRQVSQRIEWLEIEQTDHRFVADIADGHDVVIMGADKWHQVTDPTYYPDVEARDRAVAALPQVAIAPRGGLALPDNAVVLDLPPEVQHVSSTVARSGLRHLMLPEAARFDTETGWWSD